MRRYSPFTRRSASWASARRVAIDRTRTDTIGLDSAIMEICSRIMVRNNEVTGRRGPVPHGIAGMV